jgi:hypothetical protein
MADKKFCDFCGKEITGKSFAITIFDRAADKDTYEQDACVSCKVKARKALDFIRQSKAA